MDQKQKGLVGLGAMAVLAAATVLGSEPLYKAIDNIGKVPASYTAGTYTGTAEGFGGAVIASVTVSDKEITAVDLSGEWETPGIGSLALEQLPAVIIEKQSSQVDAVAGATITSDAVAAAAADALAQASGEKAVTVLETTTAAETEAETEPETTAAVTETEAKPAELPAGTYRAKAKGMMGDVEVEVVMDGDQIKSVEIVSHDETPGISDPAIEKIPAAIIEAQNTEVDGIAGATITSDAIKAAVADCLTQAAGAASEPTTAEGEAKTYTAKAKGMMGDVEVEVVMNGTVIESVTVLSHDETPGLSDPAIEKIPAAIVAAQNAEVDAATGATITSEAIMAAVSDCLEQASADTAVSGGAAGNTYTARAKGMMGDVEVQVVVADGKIETVEVLSHDETPGLSDPAIELIPAAIVEAQSTDVDTVSSATVTSEAIIAAAEDCLKQAGIVQ